jgi:hypothetical protein
VETFARWQCPHCPVVVEALAADAKDKKAVVCARHFWGSDPCPNRPPTDLRGQRKAKAPATAAVEANTASIDKNTEQQRATNELLQKQLDASLQQLAVQQELVALGRARADRWKRTSRGYHADSNVSSPRSSDNDGERESKRARVHSNIHEGGRRFELDRLGSVLGMDAPEEPEDVDAASTLIKKRAGEVRREASRAKDDLGRVDVMLGLQPLAHPDTRVEAVAQLKKAVSVQAMAPVAKGKSSKSQEERLRRERDSAFTERDGAIKRMKTVSAVREAVEKHAKKALVVAHPDKIGDAGRAVTQALNAIREETRKLPVAGGSGSRM